LSLEQGEASSVGIRLVPGTGENVNPFGAIASVVGDQSGPWTGWIDPALV